MNWVVEQDGDENSRRVAEAALKQGHHIVPVSKRGYSFGGDGVLFEPNQIFFGGTLLAYGDTSMVRAVQTRTRPSGQGPGAWAPWDRMRCSAYLPWLGSLSAQKRRSFHPLGELHLPEIRDMLYEALGEDGCIFLRPDDNDKRFSGSIVAREHYDSFVGYHRANLAEKNTLCMAARPIPMLYEWRCVVVENRVVTSSQYKKDGRLAVEPGCPAEVKRIAVLAADYWEEAPPACVVDVVDTGKSFDVVEVGTVNCAGLYACDADVFVRELSALAEKYPEARS